MYFASEIPALSATFVYNEIFHFAERICPVEIASVRPPATPANEDVISRLGEKIFYLYGRSKSERLKSVLRIFAKHPFNFVRAVFALAYDFISLGIFSRNAAGMVFRFTYAAILAEEMERKQIDHLHVHFAHVPGDIGMYASLMTSIPYSITGHANDLYERGWLLRQKTQRSLFFATISEFNRKALIAKGCNGEKIKIVRCGIDQKDFNFRSDFSANLSKFRIGSLGRLVTKKGFHTLLDSCAILQSNNFDFQLEIAGDGPLAEQLQKQVNLLGLKDSVSFLGAMSHSKVSEWMACLDVFALACCEDEYGDVDGIPVVLMEAMAIGVPVVTTNVSGLPELVSNEETGLVGSPENAKSIALLLTRLIDDPQLKNNLSSNAKTLVDAEFSIQTNVDKLGGLIFQTEKTT